MGMAASQARFLGLTARKTNVEYEGQQVNQQRTVLANESSGLFNQMLALQVPTPPSAQDYYNTRYKLDTSNMTTPIQGDVSITKWDTAPGVGYDITLEYAYTDKIGYRGAAISSGATITRAQATDPYVIKIGSKELLATTTDDEENIKQIIADHKMVDDAEFYKYTTQTEAGTTAVYYVTKAEVENATGVDELGNPVTKTQNDINQYYVANGTRKAKTTAEASFDGSEDGRFETIHISSVNTEGMKPSEVSALRGLIGQDITLDFTQVQDDAGYDAAMKEYEYQKMLYERAIQDINTKTEIIQQQDRTLELRLKQLDTEQEAIKTEMDAVKEVIQKNVESTFKTFA